MAETRELPGLESIDAVPMYDQWRTMAVLKMEAVVNAYEGTLIDGSMSHDSLENFIFKKTLMGWWIYLRPKIRYKKLNPPEIYLLKKLDNYFCNPKDIPDHLAIDCMLVLRELLERLKYTTPEKKQMDPTNWPAQLNGL